MMKNVKKVQRAMVIALMMVLTVPVVSLADHKKHFKEGQKFEENRQWDKAAEAYALAASEKPGNTEYQLYLNRALVNAAIMLVERGDRLADQKDYQAAYQTYRQAYAYDPSNDLALIKARRTLEAMGLPTTDLPSGRDPMGPQNRPRDESPNSKAIYSTSYNGILQSTTGTLRVPAELIVPKSSKFRDMPIIYRDNYLLAIIEQLAQTIGLNVLFDQTTQNQYKSFKTSFELRNVTAPRALEMILKANNLMYMQIDTRTIIVASDNAQSRSRYEPFAVRTFYIKNQEAEQVKTAVGGALQSKYITTVKQLNALIVRDTATNLELIANLIDAIDKSKAEVLVDVQIYEVGRDDLLQIGNQFGNKDSNGSFGSPIFGGYGSNPDTATPRAHQFINSTVLGFALSLTPSAISFFQSKGKAKLLASTQVHVLDSENQTIRIGRRVPIQTASIPTYNYPTTVNNGQGNQNGVNNQNPFYGLNNGYPQIQYENVGLNIDMKPSVYEDEVQLTMKIESSSIDSSTGTLTPSFNQRTMNSVARIRDGQTTMIAGVSQNEESRTTKGLPVLGGLPWIGRLFATPETINRQSDVVITVTPHILRRADIEDKDHLARSAGTQLDPNTQLTIEQIVQVADAVEAEKSQVAGAQPPVQLPSTLGQPTTPATSPSSPTVVPTSNITGGSAPIGVVVNPPPTVKPQVTRETVSQPGAPQKKPVNDPDDDDDDDEEDVDAQQNSPVTLSVRAQSAVATKGQDFYVAVLVNGNQLISSTSFSMTFDPGVIEVKSIRDGGLMRAGGVNPDLQFTAEGGLLNVQLTRPAGSSGVRASGQLLLIVFTTKNPGQSPMTINESQTFVRTATGQLVPLKFQSSEVTVR